MKSKIAAVVAASVMGMIAMPAVKRSNNAGESAMNRVQPKPEVEVQVKKPGTNNHKH